MPVPLQLRLACVRLRSPERCAVSPRLLRQTCAAFALVAATAVVGPLRPRVSAAAGPRVLPLAARDPAIVASVAAPGEAPTRGVERVVDLRLEVDGLAQALQDRRDQAKDDLRSLRAERADFERRLRLARVRNAALRAAADEAQRGDADRRRQSQRWLVPAREAVAIVREHLQHALPFAQASREAALDRIERDLAAVEPDIARAMDRLWRLVEDEAALGAEVAWTRQAIELDGTAQLSEVLRIAMALLYVRTPDGRHAWAVRDGETWRFEAVRDPLAIAVIDALFVAAEAGSALGARELLVPSAVVAHEVHGHGGAP